MLEFALSILFCWGVPFRCSEVMARGSLLPALLILALAPAFVPSVPRAPVEGPAAAAAAGVVPLLIAQPALAEEWAESGDALV